YRNRQARSPRAQCCFRPQAKLMDGLDRTGRGSFILPPPEGGLAPRQRTIFRCVPACEPPAPSRGRLTDVKAPRHVSLRFAVSKSLDRSLPLMRGHRPNFTPRAFARVRRSPVRARRPIPKEPNTRLPVVVGRG